MADGLLGVRDTVESSARSPAVQAGPPRQTLPLIIAPGYMVISTQSGKAAIVTAAPSMHRSLQPSIVTDTRIFTTPLTPTTLPSSSSASTTTQSANPSSSPSTAPSHGLSTAKLAAVVVVPLVLLAILSPIAIVWYISWRRKRRTVKRQSDRSSHQKPLLTQYPGVSVTPQHHLNRASSKPPASRPKNAKRIVSVPTPTFSSFNFELSRPASIHTSNPQPARRLVPRNRRSATLSWGAPPPYASPTQTFFSSTPVPRLDTPDITGSPLVETAQMVHIRPVSSQPPRLERINSRLPTHGPAAMSATPLTSPGRHPVQNQDVSSMLQPPNAAHTRQGSADSTAESLQFRSSLQRPFSFQPPASPAPSDISGLSFDPTLWASMTYGRDSMISPIDDQDEAEQTKPHHIV